VFHWEEFSTCEEFKAWIGFLAGMCFPMRLFFLLGKAKKVESVTQQESFWNCVKNSLLKGGQPSA
jgi:hypothetical protein